MKNNFLKVMFAILTLGFFKPTIAGAAFDHECLEKGESDFEMQKSRSGLFIVLQYQVIHNIFPWRVQRTSVFPSFNATPTELNKDLSLTHSIFIQCCYLNCQTGNSFCKEVPEGQCVHHTCH